MHCVGRRGVEPRHPAVSARCRHRLAHAPGGCVAVVSGVLEPPPAGFQPAAPPSELRDRGSRARSDGRWGRRRGSNPLPLAYEASVLAFRTSPARWCGGAHGVAGGIRTLIPGVACRDPRRWTTTTRVAELCSASRWTPGRDSHPRDTVCSRAPRSSATGRCCQGGARTPAFRVTAGRLAARLPGTNSVDGCGCN